MAGSEGVVLPCIDAFDIYRSFGVPYFLRVDVEGVRPRYISVESDKVAFDEVEAQIGLARELG